MILNRTIQNFRQQSGVTMIEALVALFVFSIGALGLAAMQTASLVQGDDSRQRSLAIWKAQELAERIRSTKTIDNPDGLAAAYVAAIGNNTAATIGVDSAANTVDTLNLCDNAPNVRCADYRNNAGNQVAGAACTDAQMVDFDIWEVLCEGDTGLATDEGDATGDDGAGSRGILGMEIALVPSPTVVADAINGVNVNVNEYFIYIEWVARSADTNEDITDDAAAVNIQTDLCGRQNVNVDSRLDVYCLRFHQ